MKFANQNGEKGLGQGEMKKSQGFVEKKSKEISTSRREIFTNP